LGRKKTHLNFLSLKTLFHITPLSGEKVSLKMFHLIAKETKETLVVTGEMTAAEVASGLRNLILEKESQLDVATNGEAKRELREDIVQLNARLSEVNSIPDRERTLVSSVA
jgi:hypothetical protein